jgi:predicted DNA-binding transcriptional regulator AlpA
MTTIEQKAEQRRQAKRSRTRTTQRAAKRRIDTDRNLEIVRFLNDTEVGWRYGISRPSVWRWVKTGYLPDPEALGPNTKRWRVATLDEWDQQRETQQQTITPVLAGQ